MVSFSGYGWGWVTGHYLTHQALTSIPVNHGMVLGNSYLFLSVALSLFLSTNASQMLTPASHAQASNSYRCAFDKDGGRNGKEVKEIHFDGNKHVLGSAVTG